MPECPQPTTLQNFCVAGQLSPASCDPATAPDVRVQLRLVTETGGNFTDLIVDPNTGTEFTPVVVTEDHVASEGCWCVCVPFANFSSVDPLNAINPTTTWWEIRLFVGSIADGTMQAIGQPRRFQIDADFDYDAACGGQAPITGTGCEGAGCIPVQCLLNPTGALPTTIDSNWCDAVIGCVQPDLDAINVNVAALDGRVATVEAAFPIPALCDEALALGDGGAINPGTDRVIVLEGSACTLKDWPVTADLNTEYTLSDNGDTSFSLVDDTGTVVSTIELGEMFDDLTEAAVLAGDGFMVTWSPTDGARIVPFPDLELGQDGAGGVTLSVGGTVVDTVGLSMTDDNTSTIRFSVGGVEVASIPLCDLLDDLPTPGVASADALIVAVSPTDGCQLIPQPTGGGGGGVYALVDNGGGTLQLTENGTPVGAPVALCDLLDDLNTPAALAGDALMVTWSPTAGCELSPVPTGGTPGAVYALVDNGDGSFQLTADGAPVGAPVALCDLLDDLPESTPRVDGRYVSVSPTAGCELVTGIPTDLVACEGGVISPVPAGAQIVREDSAPVQRQINSNTISFINYRFMTALFGDTPTTAPVGSIDVTNPDPCRSAFAVISMENFLEIRAARSMPQISMLMNSYFDNGSGALNLESFQRVTNGGDAAHPSQSPNFAIQSSGTNRGPRTSVVIPPGGTVTLRVQTEVIVPQIDLDTIFARINASGGTLGSPDFLALTRVWVSSLFSIV